MKVAIAFSGRGSNMESILEYAKDQPDIEIVGAVTNNKKAAGIEIARNYGIPIHVMPWVTPESGCSLLKSILETRDAELLVLAGFMKILPPMFFRIWNGTTVNIHPSLLPKYKGLNTHERVLEAGDQISGCSVHFVTEELDGGPLIGQSIVQVLSKDTPDTLAARVLDFEHRLYPAMIRLICEGTISFKDNNTYFRDIVLTNPIVIDTRQGISNAQRFYTGESNVPS